MNLYTYINCESHSVLPLCDPVDATEATQHACIVYVDVAELLIPQPKWSALLGASQVVIAIKDLSASAGDRRDAGLISGSGRSPAGGHGNPL